MPPEKNQPGEANKDVIIHVEGLVTGFGKKIIHDHLNLDVYRGEVLRSGKDGVRDGNAKTFADFPQNRAEVLGRNAFGDRVTVHEKVWRTPDGEPFEVLAIYSFAGDLIERVEFVK